MKSLIDADTPEMNRPTREFQFALPAAGTDSASFPSMPTCKRFMATGMLAVGTVTVGAAMPANFHVFQGVAFAIPDDAQLESLFSPGVDDLQYGAVEFAPSSEPETLNSGSVEVLQSIMDAIIPNSLFDQLDLGD